MAKLEDYWKLISAGDERLDHGQERKRNLWLELLNEASVEDDDSPDWRVLRAPGRVNLIGEHMDYNGLPVMPMAIDREIMLAFRPLPSGQVCIRSGDPAFGRREFTASKDIEPYDMGDWGNYAKAAVQALEVWASENDRPTGVGFEAVVSGDIPVGAGLSSSSALVVAMALAFDNVNSLGIPPKEMADLMAAGERYVGTQGGGMDQTACLMAEAGSAVMIQFFPTRPQASPLPSGTSIVIANTMLRAEKSGGAREKFNRRSTECRMAAAILNQRLNKPIRLLSDVFEMNPSDPLSVLNSVMRPGGLSTTELAAAVGMTEDEAREKFLRQRDGTYLQEPPEGFLPYSRAKHVLSEAVRVWSARDAMLAGDAAKMGENMNLSHISCRDDFDNSCEELEALVNCMRDSGAIGSRLTGAGWGGCAVALVPEGNEEEFMRSVIAGYYKGWLRDNRPQWADEEPEMFSSKPQRGAEVVEI